MNHQKFYCHLNEDVKEKLVQCKTQEEMDKVLTEAGIKPLDVDSLDAVSGGVRGPVPGRIVYNNEKPRG